MARGRRSAGIEDLADLVDYQQDLRGEAADCDLPLVWPCAQCGSPLAKGEGPTCPTCLEEARTA